MIVISEENLQLMMKEQYEKGLQSGIEYMEDKMLNACENGKAVAIHGRAYFIKSDIQNLRDIMNSLEVITNAD